jgi:hypothetical protein
MEKMAEGNGYDGLFIFCWDEKNVGIDEAYFPYKIPMTIDQNLQIKNGKNCQKSGKKINFSINFFK